MGVTPLVHDAAFMFDGHSQGARHHHIAYWLEEPTEILNAQEHFAEHGIKVDLGPGKHGISQAFYTYLRDPASGIRLEIFAGGYLIFDPAEPIQLGTATSLSAACSGTVQLGSDGRTEILMPRPSASAQRSDHGAHPSQDRRRRNQPVPSRHRRPSVVHSWLRAGCRGPVQLGRAGLAGVFGHSFLRLAPDLVGYDQSTHPDPAPRGPREWMRLSVHQLIGLLDALNIEKAHLVGIRSAGRSR
ncbi:hypothetical protein ATER59S_05805 [Aquamicrobium terrae]